MKQLKYLNGHICKIRVDVSMLRSMDVEDLEVISDYLKTEREFFNASTLPTGQLWDWGWLNALSDGREAYGLAPRLFEVYTENFNTLSKITGQAVKEIPALQSELAVMGELFRGYVVPTEEIIGDVLSHGRKSLTIEERAEISNNLMPLRIYSDYRNGYNLLRTQHFRVRKPIAHLVNDYASELKHFVRAWGRKYEIPTVPKFGFVTYCVVDASDYTLMPEMLESDDPTKILLEELPEDGIRRVMLDRENHNRVGKMVYNATKRKRQRSRQCNVNNLRVRADRTTVRNYTERVAKEAEETLNDEERLRRLEENLRVYPGSDDNRYRYAR